MLSNSEAGYDLLPWLRAADPEIPWVALNHMEEEWAAGGYPGRAVHFDDWLNRHWVVSQHLQQWLVFRGVSSSRIDVLHWFADADVWRPDETVKALARRRYGIADDIPVLLFAGRLCRQKRPDLFVDCMSRLARDGVGFVALVAGDGEMSLAVKSRLRQLGLADRVRMLGWLGDEQLIQAMQSADLLFLPSQGEGVALVLYEAMSCGLAVVGARVGGQAELVSDDCGVLIGPGETDQLQAYSSALYRLLRDRDLLLRMGSRARSRVLAHFDRHHFEDRLLTLVARAMGSTVDVPMIPSSVPEVSGLKWQWSTWRITQRANRLWRVWTGAEELPRLVALIIKGGLFLRFYGIKPFWERYISFRGES